MVNRLFTKDDSFTPSESATETHKIRQTSLKKKKLIVIPISSKCNILRLLYTQYGEAQQAVVFYPMLHLNSILRLPVSTCKLVT
jgi:hypothetical protein